MTNLVKQYDYALAMERQWRASMRKGECGDSGSHCESADGKYKAAAKIRQLYDSLAAELLNYERAWE